MNSQLITIPVQDIHPNPFQPRKQFDSEKLEELAASILQNGLIQPIVVRKSPVVGYELLAGERRLRASKIANLKEIPALVKELSDQEMMQQAIIENLQREDLTVIEEAESYHLLVEEGMTHDQIAHIMGKSRPYISNLIRFLQLEPEIQEALTFKELSPGHARLLIPLEREKQLSFYKQMVQEGLSVRQAEALLQAEKTPKKKSPSISQPFIQAEEERLRQYFGSPASIRMTKSGKGQLTISFSSLEEYERIIHNLK